MLHCYLMAAEVIIIDPFSSISHYLDKLFPSIVTCHVLQDLKFPSRLQVLGGLIQ